MAEDDSLPLGYSRETAIRRDALGRWFENEVAITHPKLVRALNRWLEVDEEGRFRLRNAIHWVYAQVEGPLCFVQRVALEGDRLRLELSNESRVDLPPEALFLSAEGRIACRLPSGASAWFSREAASQLGEWLEEDASGAVGLGLAGKFYPLGSGEAEGRGEVQG